MKIFTDIQGHGSRVTNIDQPGRGQTPRLDSIRTSDDLVDTLLPVLPKKAIYTCYKECSARPILEASRRI
jgi:hypothetical protein